MHFQEIFFIGLPIMLEDFDPYLTSFFRDVGTCISMVFQAVELLLGLSYFIGSKTVEGAVWLISASTNGYQEISTAAETVRDEVAEFGISFGKALLLIYYAAFKVVDCKKKLIKSFHVYYVNKLRLIQNETNLSFFLWNYSIFHRCCGPKEFVLSRNRFYL